MYVVPPMDEEPPPGFVTFVAVHLDSVRSEAARLTGGSSRADDVYSMVLSDVALHWRRLQLRRRLTGRDEAAAYLHRRLEHAWQRARWHRIGRLVGGVAFGFLALMYALPQPTP